MKKPKYAFFDIDGTLSIPLYNLNGDLVQGMTEEQWFEFNMWHNDTYKDCKSSSALTDALSTLSKDCFGLYCLTCECNSRAYFNKADFILSRYKPYFNDIRQIEFVADKEDKIRFMLRFAATKGVKPKEILYVDDDFALIVKASQAGINAKHISHFLT